MHIWFFICALGVFATIPIYFLSVEHLKLQEKYGKKKGTKIGDIFGLISGWGFFFFWMGIWVSPQPIFVIPILQTHSVVISAMNLSIPLLHVIICAVVLAPSVWLAINGVRETTLRVAEIHRTETIVTIGVYSIVRHPQYLGGLLAHLGISFLLSAWYSLLLTPIMIVLIYLISRKEEEELIKEFGKEYDDYKRKVPMLIPRFRSRALKR